MHSSWTYSLETLKSYQNYHFFVSHDHKIGQMTLKNNRAPLLCPFKLYAPFHNHWWSPIWVTVRKRTNWVLTSVTLAFNLWPWTWAWTSLLSLVITPENFKMIQWQKHNVKGVTDKWMDRLTDRLDHSYSCLVTAKDVGGQYLNQTTKSNKSLCILELLINDNISYQLIKINIIKICSWLFSTH